MCAAGVNGGCQVSFRSIGHSAIPCVFIAYCLSCRATAEALPEDFEADDLCQLSREAAAEVGGSGAVELHGGGGDLRRPSDGHCFAMSCVGMGTIL